MTDSHTDSPIDPDMDKVALGALLERHRPTLHTYVSFRLDPALRRLEHVSDIVQSALREVLERPGRFQYQNELAFRAFLQRVVEHKIANKRRYWAAEKRSIPTRAPSEQLQHDARQVAPATPSEAAIGREENERLLAALDRLSEEDRRILTMRRFLDLSIEDIAVEIGLSPSTVGYHLGRIMAELSLRMDSGADHRTETRGQLES